MYTDDVTKKAFAMRKKGCVLFVFISTCLWAIVTYFLFVYQPLHKLSPDMDLDLKVGQLESAIQKESLNYKSLMLRIKNAINNRAEGKNYEENNPDNQDVNDGFQKSDRSKENVLLGVEEVGEVGLQGEQLPQEVQPKESAGQKTAEETKTPDPVIAILVITCNRVTVDRCLDGLLRYRPSKAQFPIIVSQDCQHNPTAAVIRSYGDTITFIQNPDQSDIPVPPKEKKFNGYFKIARHYGWAINQTFNKFNYDTAIIVEDDLEIAPDFYEYFLGTHPLLKQDPTLWCVSAWNDNGKESLIDLTHPELLYRTDFFPGLGWMLTKSLWSELSTKWPKSYWDDWIREPVQRKNRACIRPEVSRTRTFGKIGVSNGLYFEKHLKFIKLNEKFVPFTKMDLTYLLKDNYDHDFVKTVYESPVVSYDELISGSVPHGGPIRIPYHTKNIYKRTAKLLGLMDDVRSGVPRTGYRGVVSFMYKGRRVYLAPGANWNGYHTDWN